MSALARIAVGIGIAAALEYAAVSFVTADLTWPSGMFTTWGIGERAFFLLETTLALFLGGLIAGCLPTWVGRSTKV